MSTHSDGLFPANRASRSVQRWWILAAALVVLISNSVILQGYPALVPFVKDDLHLNLAEAGIVANITGLGMAIGVMTAGWVVDRKGDRVVVIWGGLGTGIAALLAAFASVSVSLLLFVSVLVGGWAASVTPAGSSAVMGEFPRHQRGVAMSVLQTGVPVGGMIAAATLPLVAVHFGWRPALAIAAGTAVVGGILAYLFYQIAQAPRRSRSETPKGLVDVASLFNRNILVIGGCGIALVTGQYCLVTYVVLFLHTTWHLPLLVASFFLAITQLAGAIGRVLWGWFSDRLLAGSRRFTLAILTVVGGVGLVSIAWIPRQSSVAFMVAAVIVAGACINGWPGIWIAMLAEGAPLGLQARAVAAGLTINQPAIVLGPLLFGLVVDHTGSYQLAWTALAIVLVGAAALIVRAKEPSRSDIPAVDSALA